MIMACLGLACVMSTLSFFKFGNGVLGNSVQQIYNLLMTIPQREAMALNNESEQ